MIAIILISALAALYVWVFISQLTTPGFGWLQRGLRESFLRPLLSCPWCTGFWLSLVFVVLMSWWQIMLDPVMTPLAVLASSALVGFAGSFTGGIADDDDA